jgi:hypothetical protein
MAPFDPVDDDQGGACARWRRWMRVLISVFVASVKRPVEPERGNNRQGFVEQSSDEDYVDDDGQDYDSDGDFDSGDSDYTWPARDDFSSNRHQAQN